MPKGYFGLDPIEHEHAHHRWLRDVQRDIGEDYQRLHERAMTDPQRSGHGGEATWKSLLTDWLPNSYEVGTRKYILLENGQESLETDLVVFRPSYPVPLRTREEVLAGGVAAAFSVKLTLDSAGIRDAHERAVSIRRGLYPRAGTPRIEMLPPFPVGLLAHSHVWKGPNSTPYSNITKACRDLDMSLVTHPRESLDYLCVADLGAWTQFRAPYIPPNIAAQMPFASNTQQREGYAITAVSEPDPDNSPPGIATLIAALLTRFSYTDHEIAPLADSLRRTGTLGKGSGTQRLWELRDIFTENVRNRLPLLGLQDNDQEWGATLF